MRDLKNTIYSGLVYLLGKQCADGRWLDFALPPGPSDIWVTAYVGHSLAQVANLISDHAVQESLKSAAEWTVRSRSADFGWAYNNRTETDADSTANCINFLTSIGKSVDEQSFARLLEFQKPDGGFCTYIKDDRNSWGDSHPEITPAALMALLKNLSLEHEAIRKGTKFVLDNRGPDGLWQSFWTFTPLYSTAANLRFLNRIGKRVDATSFSVAQIELRTGFELALAGECLLLVDYPQARSLLDAVASRLMDIQQPDGSWQEAPIVRLTATSSHKPWMEANSGDFYADWNRVFTTATALRFLVQYKQFCAPELEMSQ